MAGTKKISELRGYANFLLEVGVLARTPRSGFRHLGGWAQSISEHLLRTAYIGLVLGTIEHEKDKSIDVQQVIENCLYHDFGEARGSDLDYISQQYSTSDETSAIKDATNTLPIADRVMRGFVETEEQDTKEGVIAKDADNLELLLTLREILENGNQQAKEWVPSVFKRLKLESSGKLGKEIMTTGINDWMIGKVTDENGVHRGNKPGNKK